MTYIPYYKFFMYTYAIQTHVIYICILLHICMYIHMCIYIIFLSYTFFFVSFNSSLPSLTLLNFLPCILLMPHHFLLESLGSPPSLFTCNPYLLPSVCARLATRVYNLNKTVKIEYLIL